MELNKKFDEALKKFADRYKGNKNVVGIIVSGSYIHSKPDKNSDLDVYIVLKKSNMRERGNTWINGIEIEYFINSVKQVKYYFKREREGKDSPSTAHMFVNSKVLLIRGNYLSNLIKEAKTILKKKTPLMNNHERENFKYFLDDYRKDLEDVYLRKDRFVFELIASRLIEEVLHAFYRIKRIPKEKHKTLRIYLKKFDKDFEELFSQAVTEDSFSKKFKKINSLVDYTEKLVGGKRPREWKLKTKYTYKK